MLVHYGVTLHFCSLLTHVLQRHCLVVSPYANMHFCSQKVPLSEEDIKQWEDVRILIIDEIFFMKDKEPILLDKRLKEIRDRNKPFGGFIIIFAGDFRQLEPVKSSEYDLLFSSKSSCHWENCINTIIILDNGHRFKDDPQYGRDLKRFWLDNLSRKARDRINTRVVGSKDLTLPIKFVGDV